MRKIKAYTLLFVICGLFLISAAAILQFFTPAGDSHPEFSAGEQSFDNVREIIVISGALPVTIEETDDSACTVSWRSGLPLIISCDEY